jgi:hypothetical protein
MPISQFSPPERSRTTLDAALETVCQIKAGHKRWMMFSPSTTDDRKLLYPHPVYSVRLDAFLAGQSLSATLKKTGWMYFLRNRRLGLVCGEVSLVSGRHKNARLSEGPFVHRAFKLFEKSTRDSRISRGRYELRSLRVESAHLFCLWLKVDRRVDYFIPVTSSSALLRAGNWISRKEFTTALRAEGQRIRAAQKLMSHLLEQHHGRTRDG